MPTIRFLPDDVVVTCAEGTSLFDAGGTERVGIDTACVGKGTCGLCRVRIIEGADNLTPYGDEERKHLGNVYHLTRVRLACRAQVLGGELTVEVIAKKKKAKKK